MIWTLIKQVLLAFWTSNQRTTGYFSAQNPGPSQINRGQQTSTGPPFVLVFNQKGCIRQICHLPTSQLSPSLIEQIESDIISDVTEDSFSGVSTFHCCCGEGLEDSISAINLFELQGKLHTMVLLIMARVDAAENCFHNKTLSVPKVIRFDK